MLQLTLLLLWAINIPLGTKVSVPAAALDFAAALGLCVLSYYEHSRSVRPSLLINVYLLLSLLFDIARLRTLWLLHGAVVRNLAVVMTISTAVKVAVLILEAQDKRSILLGQFMDLPPEATSGIYNRSLFWWLNPLFWKGFSNILRIGDLYSIDPDLKSSVLQQRFRARWDVAKQDHKYALMITTFLVMKWEILVSVIPRILIIGFKYSNPFLLERTVEYVNNRQYQPENVGLGLIAAYSLVYTGLALLTASYMHLSNRILVRIRGGLVTLIYGQTIDLSITALDESAALTLMSTDVQTIVDSLRWGSEAYGAVLEIGLAMYVLYTQLGLAVLAPAIVALLSCIGAVYVAWITPAYQTAWNAAIQTRVSFTSTMLGSMRPVKLLGLSGIVGAIAQSLRVHEVRESYRLRVVLLIRVVFQNGVSLFAPLATFATLGLIAGTRGQGLTTAKAFSVLSVINLIVQPLQMLAVAMPILATSISSYSRIQQFLSRPTRKDHRLSILAAGGRHSSSATYPSEEKGIELQELRSASKAVTDDTLVVKDGSFGWDEVSDPIVQDVNLRIRTSSLVLVIGPVGSGKSTLVKGLLGETPSSQGFVYSNTLRSGFADQDGWVQNMSIKEAVIGTSNYDAAWFGRVVECCALREDLRNFKYGEDTVVGSNGITLSGGQKQRVALARAVYAKEDLLILDDIFSGLDADTEEHIFNRLFSTRGLLRQMKTTTILVTHAVHRLPYADHIVALSAEGTLIEQGTYAELRHGGGYVQSLTARFKDAKELVEPQAETAEPPTATRKLLIDDAEDGAARSRGEWKTYKYYFSACGWISTSLSLLWTLLFTVANKSPGLVINFWTASSAIHGGSTSKFYIALMGTASAVALTCLILVVYQIFLDMGPRSSNGLHLSLLNTVMRAPLSFFTRVDSGTTLNRFSQDMTLVDVELPSAFVNAIFAAAGMLVLGGLICASASYFLATVPVLFAALYGIQTVYLRTSRQIRLLDLEAKAPLYSHFAETLGGLVSIRAFGWTNHFREQHLQLLDQSQKPFYLLFCIQRWLQVVLDLMVAGLAALLVTIVVQTRASINPGLVGLGLLNIMTFSNELAEVVKEWTLLETSIGATSRLKDFVATTETETKPGEDIEPTANWPEEGHIEIRHFGASYSETSDLVLDNINLDIRAGEKVGICGRSGSGKSSLLASLFHLLEYRDGYIAVDGQDLTFVPRETVRQRLNVIPQEPYFVAKVNCPL